MSLPTEKFAMILTLSGSRRITSAGKRSLWQGMIASAPSAARSRASVSSALSSGLSLAS